MSENNSSSGSFIGSVIWIIIFISIYHYFTDDKKDTTSTYTPSSTYYNSYTPTPSYSNSYSSSYSEEEEEKDCSSLEPENPYDYDSGHYAGFEWGENGSYCSGNSQSFIEGCEEYERQDEIFTQCENNQ